jgi:hypothetical protein
MDDISLGKEDFGMVTRILRNTEKTSFGQDNLTRAGSYETPIPWNIVVLVTQRIRIHSVALFGNAQLKHPAILIKLY